MLKISTRGQYAFLIMTDLAEVEEGKYVPLKTLSHRHNMSAKYLEQILIQLSKAGLVSGCRGANGGYRLVKPASEYSIGEILRTTEGDLSLRCNSEGHTVSNAGNEDFWNHFDEVVNKYVDSVTLESVAEKNRQFVGFEYCI